MTPDSLRALFDRVARGETSPEGALSALKNFPYQDLGHACHGVLYALSLHDEKGIDEIVH